MWSRWLLVGFLLLVLSVAFKNSVHPKGEDPSPEQDNPNMLQWQKTVEGTDGDTVILPCSTKDETDISHEEVEWVFGADRAAEGENVHWRYQGEDHLHQQSANFINLTSLFKEELSSGNCSLRLLVNTSHSGTYYCHVVIDGKRHDCLVNLKVLPKGEESSQILQDVTVSPDKPPRGTDRQNNIIGGAVGGVLGVAALIIIIAFVVWYRKRRNPLCPQRRNANNPPVYQGVPLQAQQPPQNQGNEPVDQNPNGEQNQMLENEDQDDPADGN